MQNMGGAVFVSVGNNILQNILDKASAANELHGVDVKAVIAAAATQFPIHSKYIMFKYKGAETIKWDTNLTDYRMEVNVPWGPHHLASIKLRERTPLTIPSYPQQLVFHECCMRSHFTPQVLLGAAQGAR